MFKFFTAIQEGKSYDEALQASGLTDQQVKDFCKEKQMSVADLTKEVANEIMKSLDERDQGSKGNTDQNLSAVDIKNIMFDFKRELLGDIEKAKSDIRKDSKMVHPEGKGFDQPKGDEGNKAPGVIMGHTRGYKDLVEGEKQLVDILMGRCEPKFDEDAKISVADSKDIIDYRLRKQVRGKALAGTFGRKAIEAGSNDWNPTDLASMLLVRLGEISNIANTIPTIEIARGTAMDVPLLTTRPTVYLMATETSSPTGSAIGNSKITLTAKLLKALVEWTDVADEDLAIALLPSIEDKLVEAIGNAEDDWILNGDTTATHMDADITAADDHRKTAKGLRKLALAGSLTTAFGNTFTAALMDSLKASLGKYSMMEEVQYCNYVLGATNYHNMEALSQMKEARQAAEFATMVTGFRKNPTYLGVPILGSSLVRENLNASGVQDGVTTDRTAPLCYNSRYFRRGLKRNITFEMDKAIKTGVISLVASIRRDFQPIEAPSATIKSVGAGINAST
jgi:hypothetical protein